MTNLKTALSILYRVYKLHRNPDWDGGGASAIFYVTYLNARKFLMALPDNVPNPSNIHPDNDGFIEIEWGEKESNFSFYITEESVVLYAGLSNKKHYSGRFLYG